MLNFETGDVLKAVESGVVLAHVCNNKGGSGVRLVVATETK